MVFVNLFFIFLIVFVIFHILSVKTWVYSDLQKCRIWENCQHYQKLITKSTLIPPNHILSFWTNLLNNNNVWCLCCYSRKNDQIWADSSSTLSPTILSSCWFQLVRDYSQVFTLRIWKITKTIRNVKEKIPKPIF